MELTVTYILSQIFTILMYIFLGVTYQVKDRYKILFFCILANTSQGIAYLLLNAYSGLIMCILAVIRDIALILISDRIKDEEKQRKANLLVIIVFFVIAIISAIPTYDGFWSLFSIFATLIYTYSIWQKNETLYKLLGSPVGICWIIYNTAVKSIFGIILESMLLITSIVGYIRSKKTKSTK